VSAELARTPARVSREMPGSTGEPEAAVPSHWRAFNCGLARWPYGHEMMAPIVPDTVPLLGLRHPVSGLVPGGADLDRLPP